MTGSTPHPSKPISATVRAVATSILVGAGTVPAETEPPPISLFTDRSEVAAVSLSPTGRYLAASIRQGDEAAFQVITLPEREVKVNFPMGTEREIARIYWATDDLLLVSPARQALTLDIMGLTLELMTVDAETGQTERVGGGSLIDILPDDPEHVLISASSNRFGQAHLLNLKSKSMRRVASGPAPYGSFVPNAEGKVVIGTGENENANIEVHYREGQKWRLIGRHDSLGHGWIPARFGPRPGTFLTLDSRDAATRGLGLYDVETDTHQVLLRHPQVDVTSLYYDFGQRNLWGVRFDPDYPKIMYVSRRHPLARQHAALVKMFPDDTVTFTSFTRDHSKLVAVVSGDRRPGDYMLVDAAAGQVDMLMARRPRLPQEALSPMQPVEFSVRDGAKVYGYLTSAPDTPKPGPMVVYIHGGPHQVRDYWGFNADVQLLASRGYHVLQVNYRGSCCYGISYERTGFGEWGRLIENDVIDAVRWAIEEGIADADRICAYGNSYGAYSALMGAAIEPDLYRCAVGGAGIYDLTLLEKSGDIRQRRAGIAYLRRAVGDDDEKLRARSPVYLADRIKARILLVHGGSDRRAPPQHAQRLRAALREAGNEPEWLYETEQAHGFGGNEGRRMLYERILDFLAENIGGTSATSG